MTDHASPSSLCLDSGSKRSAMEVIVTYKAILVQAEDSKAAEDRIKCAADLADRFGALLIGCGSEEIPSFVGDPMFVTNPDLLTVIEDQVDSRLDAAHATFETLAAGRERRWVSQHLTPAEALVLAARTADLIVSSPPPRALTASGQQAGPGFLVVASGRPVLVVPEKKDHLYGDRVLICWKDTREARRAVADALPFLKAAKSVLVATVARPAILGDACREVNEVADALRRHGVSAEGEALTKDERRAVDILLDRASAFGTDLLVAGGYGHSRFGEWVMGGLTRSLLTENDRFVLFSH